MRQDNLNTLRQNAMITIKKILKAFLYERNAVTALEYALLGSLIATAIITGATNLGLNIQALFSNVADQVAAVISVAL